MTANHWDPTLDEHAGIDNEPLSSEQPLEHEPLADLTTAEPNTLLSEAELPQETTRNYFGTPMEDMAHWEHQTTPFTCAVEAQRGILEACTGKTFSEAELAAEAAEHGWLHTSFSEEGAGTQVVDVGKLLELHGIATHQASDAAMGDIVSELAAGHKVIVGVNSADLWNPSPFSDLFSQGADHAIWVTGVDTSDPNNIKVIINDSGDPTGAGKSYSLDQFADAWEDSGHFYVATDSAPPDLHISASGFDIDTGFFSDIVEWAKAHALPIGLGVVAVGASGLAVSDLMRKRRLCESSKSLREKVRNRTKRQPDEPGQLPEV